MIEFLRSCYGALSSWAVVIMIALSPLSAAAQDLSGFEDPDAAGVSFRRFVLPGEASITVTVLGAAGGTGIYEVGRETDLGRLIALTGSSLAETRAGESRRITLRLLRSTSGRRQVVYEASLGDLLSIEGRYPQLEHNDLLIIESKFRRVFGWREVLSIFTATAAAVLTVERLTRIFN